MQSAAPEAVDLRSESAETQRLYGLDDRNTAEFGTRCLLARRLVERGVRFIQLYSGDVERLGRTRRRRGQPRHDVRADRQARRRPAQGPEAAGASR